MSEQTIVSPEVERKNLKLGLGLLLFALITVGVAMINFYYLGLPKDANRMRERHKKKSAIEAQALPEALQSTESQQTTGTSEDGE